MTTLDAHCHCGNFSVRFTTRRTPDNLNLVACPCSFCRAHGAVYVADPEGDAVISAQRPADIIRYRFGEKTTDYIVCGRCGNFIAAVLESGGRCFAAINLMLTGEQPLPQRTDSAWTAQSAAERVAFRARRWTPTRLEGVSPTGD